jgi:radical SAM protein with 4Fe4S-binding SPASM domain
MEVIEIIDEIKHSYYDDDKSFNSEVEIGSSQTSPKLTVTKVTSSEVWKYFIKDSNYKKNKKATCKFCNKVYTCSGGSTSNLTKHLNKFHNTQMGGSKKISKELTIKDMFNKSKVFIVYILLLFFF